MMVSFLKSTINTELKKKRNKISLDQPIIKNNKLPNLDRAIGYAQNLTEVQVGTNSIDIGNITGATSLIETQLDRFNIQTQSIIGDGTDGKVFGGFVQSIGNSEDDVGLCKFVNTAGLNNVVVPNLKVYGSGAPQAIAVAKEDITKKINDNKETLNTFLDGLPPVLGAPSGGFLGSVLKVAGIAGGLGGMLQQTSPFAGITNQFNNIKDQVLDETGISGVIDSVQGTFRNATNFVNTQIDGINGVIDNAIGGLVGNPLSGLDDALSINIGDQTFSTNIGGTLQNIGEQVTGNITSQTRNLISGSIPTLELPSIVGNIASGGQSRIAAIGRLTELDENTATIVDKFEPLSAVKNAESPVEALDILKKNGEANGATAAEITAIQNSYSKKILDASNFNLTLSSVIANDATSPSGAPYVLDLSKKFTYVSSIEELELEISSKLTHADARDVTSVVIHATETFTNKNIGAEEIDAIQKKLGEDEIGYHYVIRRDGRLQRGRPVEKEGNHISTGNYNKTSIGLVMVGGINRASTEQSFETSSASFTRAQYNTLEQFLQVFYNNFSGGEVFGHSDIETDELDPYFDVSEYILSLFGKVNESFKELPETEFAQDITNENLTELVNVEDVSTGGSNLFRVNYAVQQTNGQRVDPDALVDQIPERLQLLANYMKKNLVITSGFRTKAQGDAIGSSENSKHRTGQAVDVSRGGMSNAQLQSFIGYAIQVGFRGIGVYNGHIHLDTGSKRCWGPESTRRSLQTRGFEWAVETLNTNGYLTA